MLCCSCVCRVRLCVFVHMFVWCVYDVRCAVVCLFCCVCVVLCLCARGLCVRYGVVLCGLCFVVCVRVCVCLCV